PGLNTGTHHAHGPLTHRSNTNRSARNSAPASAGKTATASNTAGAEDTANPPRHAQPIHTFWQLTRSRRAPAPSRVGRERSPPASAGGDLAAVAVGFEPTDGGHPPSAFEALTFGHSDTPPRK